MKRAAITTVLGAMILTTACDSQRVESEAPQAEALPQTEPLEVFEVGATAETGFIGFTLKSIETKKAVRDPDWSPPAGPGETFVVARYEIKNRGEEPLDPFELPQIALIDDNGVEYSWDAEASTSDGDSSGWDAINPGVVYKGTRSFKVVEERYDPEAWQIVIKTDPAIAYRLK